MEIRVGFPGRWSGFVRRKFMNWLTFVRVITLILNEAGSVSRGKARGGE